MRRPPPPLPFPLPTKPPPQYGLIDAIIAKPQLYETRTGATA